MDYNYQDKGNYFRGLLILIGKDNIINVEEKNKILEIGNLLGYDGKFCNDAVNDFLENKYISMHPPKFTNETVAKHFLIDAVRLSLVDQDMHTEELEWLEKVASNNNIKSEWLDQTIRDHASEACGNGIVENSKILQY